MTKVRIVEVGLRDGLQNEAQILTVNQKSKIAVELVAAGLSHIEIGAFVSPNWVPQMADTEALIKNVSKKIESKKMKNFSTLVPNLTGMEKAIANGIKEVAIFAACTESFSQKNINCSIDESYERFKPVMSLAKAHKIKVRGYLSTAFGCPFEGSVSEKIVLQQIERMLKLGVYEVSVGDTIGVAHAGQVAAIFKKIDQQFGLKQIAGHFHDTRGQALANILMALDKGVTVFDSSIGGLGGCPYAPGAAGNVATEDVAYMLEGLKISTGIDLDKILLLNKKLQSFMNRPLPSKMGKIGRLKAIRKV